VTPPVVAFLALVALTEKRRCSLIICSTLTDASLARRRPAGDLDAAASRTSGATSSSLDSLLATGLAGGCLSAESSGAELDST